MTDCTRVVIDHGPSCIEADKITGVYLWSVTHDGLLILILVAGESRRHTWLGGDFYFDNVILVLISHSFHVRTRMWADLDLGLFAL